MFQTFPDDATNTTHAAVRERVAALCVELVRLGLDALLVPRADEFQGEYIPPSSDRLRFVTGFTGSAGFAIVARKTAVLFTDGRYAVQARAETDPTIYMLTASPAEKPLDWLKLHLAKGAVVGFDPRLHTLGEIERLGKGLAAAGIKLKPVSRNPIDRVWRAERPAPPSSPVRAHPIEYAGQPAADKIADLQKRLLSDVQGDGQAKVADFVVLTQTDSIAWLFNIRASDVAHTPVLLAYAIVPAKGRAELYVDAARLNREVKAHLGRGVAVKPPETFMARLTELKAEHRKVRLDPETAPYAIARRLGATSIVRAGDPCTVPKAIKNDTEIAGARTAHARDGAAMVRFLAWLDQALAAGEALDEIAIVERLEAYRAATGALQEIAFDTISGSGPNGAIVHYRVSRASNRQLRQGELLLVDSGAQYLDATTDITRTLAIGAPGAELRERYTLVLKGHVALSMARFPKGTRGADLDPIARSGLWSAGLDFDHGTGHGVGSYLSVHEGPASISKRGMVALEPGMIISNEPGYYREGAYGIRIENLVLVRPPEPVRGGDRAMMSFETLTLCPYDRRLIDVALLTPAERAWIDGYHTRVRKALSAGLAAAERRWLEAATAVL